MKKAVSRVIQSSIICAFLVTAYSICLNQEHQLGVSLQHQSTTEYKYPIAGVIYDVAMMNDVEKINRDALNATKVGVDSEYELNNDDENVTTEEVSEEEYEFTNEAYVVSYNGLNVREDASIESDAVGSLTFGTPVEYSEVENEDEFVAIELDDGSVGYISSDYLDTDLQEYGTSHNVAYDKRKSYMGYKSITSTKTKQYKLQQMAYTDSNTGIRVVNGRYCVAVGSGYSASVGTFIDVVLSDGTVLPCIVGDAKKNIDTDSTNTVGNDGGVVEFIVNKSSISSDSRHHGDMSYTDGLSANVSEIIVYPAGL